MSALTPTEKYNLEKLLGMSSGYVLNFSDSSFGQFVAEIVGIDIHSEHYRQNGTSKANKLRTFWQLESDHSVGKLIQALTDHAVAIRPPETPQDRALVDLCRAAAVRLLAGSPILEPLKLHAKALDANHLAEQIRRLEGAVDTDPGLAIGTAKELVETCCKTILAERGKPVSGTPEMSTLTKETLRELKLVPEGIPEQAKGAGVIRRLLGNLGTIGNNLAELRGLYGTGHGKHGKAAGLTPRHARLAAGAASTLARFLFETHLDTKPRA